MQQNTKRTTLSQAAGLLSLGLLLQVAFTYPVWMYDEWRVLPTIPLISYLSLDWIALDYLNIGLLIFTLIVIMFAPQRRNWYLVYIILICLFFIQDTARFQYSIYAFSALLAFLYFQQDKHNEQLLQALQMGLIGIYFWAGFYHASPAYTQLLFPDIWWWVMPFEHVQMVAYLPAIFAFLVAIGLFFTKTRPWAIGIAFVYHGLQLSLHFPPNQYDYPITWVFHIVSICLVIVLFANERNPIFYQASAYLKSFPIVPYAFILFGTFPLFQFATPLHPTLFLQPSETIMSSTTHFFHRQDRFCLPPVTDEYLFTSSTDILGQKILRITMDNWSTSELGVPYLMNDFQQKSLLTKLCECLDYEHQGGFSIIRWDNWTLKESVEEIRCEDLR